MSRIFALLFAFIVVFSTSHALKGRRIINGTSIIPFQYKSLVSIFLDGRHDCGGIILDGDTVMTAAHCFHKVKDPKRLLVHVGAHDLEKPPPTEQKVKVRKIITHPNWKPDKVDEKSPYDFQILKLTRCVSEGTAIKFARIPTVQGKAVVRPGDACEVVGWGATFFLGGMNNETPLKGAMKIVKNDVCRAKGNVTSHYQVVDRTFICAKSAYVTTSACMGDSGSPLFCYPKADNHKRIVAGLVSFGDFPCGKDGFPVAFGRISVVVNWVKRNMRGKCKR